MKNIVDHALTATARDIVLAQGFSPVLADLVEVVVHPATDDAAEQAEIVWGFDGMRKGKAKRIALAISYAPSDTMADRLQGDSLADTVVAILPMLPASMRTAPIPAWATARGNRLQDSLARARGISHAAVRTQTALAA